MNVISPKKPKDKNWHDCGEMSPDFNLGYGGHLWKLEGITVISSVEAVHDPDDMPERNGPDYHISISRGPGVRCNSKDCKVVCRAFGDGLKVDKIPALFPSEKKPIKANFMVYMV